MASDFRIEALRPEERERLLAFLDDGLRSGRRGRIAAEYPLTQEARRHIVAVNQGSLCAHALGSRVSIVARGRELTLGMIGLVYCHPEYRNRGLGLAARCVEAAAQQLARDGCGMVVLWSELEEYYRALGFAPAGQEIIYSISRAACDAWAARQDAEFSVSRPRDSNELWLQLEVLYADKPVHQRRSPGDLRKLAESPDCQFVVAHAGERGGQPVAYAALGRGDDFGGVVHEWAGSPAGVMACVCALSQSRDELAELAVLASPLEEGPTAALRQAHALRCPGPFGLARLMDPARVWSQLSSHDKQLGGLSLTRVASSEPDAASALFRLATPSGELLLSHSETLSLLIGPKPPQAALKPLSAELRSALQERLPWPLFVWGFDSI